MAIRMSFFLAKALNGRKKRLRKKNHFHMLLMLKHQLIGSLLEGISIQIRSQSN